MGTQFVRVLFGLDIAKSLPARRMSPHSSVLFTLRHLTYRTPPSPVQLARSVKHAN